MMTLIYTHLGALILASFVALTLFAAWMDYRYPTRWVPRSVSPELRAIEFGEYLAKAAEAFQRCSNEFSDEHGDEGERFENLNEAYGTLNSAIYEFRKRAGRVPT